MSRQTPTSRRSPSILVTDVRHQKAHSAPFVARRLNSVSVDSLLSNTSEVPSAQRRTAPRRAAVPIATVSTSNYGLGSHRSRMAATGASTGGGGTSAGATRRSSSVASEQTPLLGTPLPESPMSSSSRRGGVSGGTTRNRGAGDSASIHHSQGGDGSPVKTGGGRRSVKAVPQLSNSLPSRTSKQSQRLVLIPDALDNDQLLDADSASTTTSSTKRHHHQHPTSNGGGSGSDSDDEAMRVTSYLISEGVLLAKAAKYLKEYHRARVRLYDEALFVDYLLPLLPGNGVDYRVMSSLGDNRTMERMIDISEQRDHHYEYFSASAPSESDPSEPQDFSPRQVGPMLTPTNRSEPLNEETTLLRDLRDEPQTGHDSINDETNPKNPDTTTQSETGTINSDEGEPLESHEVTLLEGGMDDGYTPTSGNTTTTTTTDPVDEEEGESAGAESSSAEGERRRQYADKQRRQHDEERAAWDRERRLESYTSHAEIFLFNYGVIVFWNFTEAQEKQIIADLCIGAESLVLNPYTDQEIQSEELQFMYALDEHEKPRIFNDLITLNSNSHMLKLAMSHAMAQSTILCSFEDRMQAHLKDVRGVPKTLALTGKLGLNREQLLRISGRLYKLRVDVNLSSNVLDIPEFFWDSEPSLFPLFNALREYLEIDERVLVLNERQSVFLELTSILGDSIAEFNMDRITIIVIWLIALSICVSLTEIGVRFLILRRAAASS